MLKYFLLLAAICDSQAMAGCILLSGSHKHFQIFIAELLVVPFALILAPVKLYIVCLLKFF